MTPDLILYIIYNYMEDFKNEFLQIISHREIAKDFLLTNAYIILQQRANLLPVSQLAVSEGEMIHIQNCLTYLEAAYDVAVENDDPDFVAFQNLYDWLSIQ